MRRNGREFSGQNDVVVWRTTKIIHVFLSGRYVILPETNTDMLSSLKLISLLKMDSWNTTFLLGRPIFRAMLVSGRVISRSRIVLVNQHQVSINHYYRWWLQGLFFQNLPPPLPLAFKVSFKYPHPKLYEKNTSFWKQQEKSVQSRLGSL